MEPPVFPPPIPERRSIYPPSPPVELLPVPAEIVTDPPCCELAVVSPASRYISPPSIAVPDPTLMRISPPLPPVAAPLATLIDPLEPELVVPEAKLNIPLVPAVPASVLLRTIIPLEVAVPSPVARLIAPPVNGSESPA